MRVDIDLLFDLVYACIDDVVVDGIDGPFLYIVCLDFEHVCQFLESKRLSFVFQISAANDQASLLLLKLFLFDLVLIE